MDQQEKIERYLCGKLSPEETAGFEAEVAADEALAQEVELQRLEMELLLQLEADALRANIQALRAGEVSPVLKKTGRLVSLRWRVVAVAASLALVAAAYWYWESHYTPAQLMAMGLDLAQPEYTVAIRKSDAQPEFDPQIVDILKNGDTQRAEEAIRYFRGFIAVDSSIQLRARLNLGHALRLAGRYDEAGLEFEQISQLPEANAEIREKAQYYRALALLGGQKPETAKALLKSIADNPEHRFQEPAQEVLSKFKKLW